MIARAAAGPAGARWGFAPTGPEDGESRRRGATRVPITLACGECKARNYKTTKSAVETGAIELKKFCKQCARHTVHRETK